MANGEQIHRTVQALLAAAQTINQANAQMARVRQTEDQLRLQQRQLDLQERSVKAKEAEAAAAQAEAQHKARLAALNESRAQAAYENEMIERDELLRKDKHGFTRDVRNEVFRSKSTLYADILGKHEDYESLEDEVKELQSLYNKARLGEPTSLAGLVQRLRQDDADPKDDTDALSQMGEYLKRANSLMASINQRTDERVRNEYIPPAWLSKPRPNPKPAPTSRGTPDREDEDPLYFLQGSESSQQGLSADAFREAKNDQQARKAIAYKLLNMLGGKSVSVDIIIDVIGNLHNQEEWSTITPAEKAELLFEVMAIKDSVD